MILALPTTHPTPTQPATFASPSETLLSDEATDVITNNVVVAWLVANLNRIVFFIVMVIVTWIIARIVRSALTKALDRSNIPSASIFVNCARLLIWFLFLLIVLKPVFGVEPTTLVTALGVSGIALSFGLKDTISNIIGGFGLMMGKVVQPGDLISVSGYTGRVKDLTWRNTIVESRDGNEFWIPNSVLNTAGLTKMTEANESIVTLDFTARGDRDLNDTAQRIADAVEKGTADLHLEGHPCIVKYTGFSPYGAEGMVLVFAQDGLLPSTVRDTVARSMNGLDCLVLDGAASVDASAPSDHDAARGAGNTAKD